MNFEEIKDVLESIDEKILMADGFEDALIGYVQIFNQTIALYDREKCIEILMKRDGMDREGAEEFFEFNVTGAYMGPETPGFATILKTLMPGGSNSAGSLPSGGPGPHSSRTPADGRRTPGLERKKAIRRPPPQEG